MNIMHWGLLLIMIGVFWYIALLDAWSTTTLLHYKQLVIDNPKIRAKVYKVDKEKGAIRYEMNRLARVFFRKFGVKKGIIIYDVLITFPLLTFLVLIYYYYDNSGYLLVAAAMFYMGLLFSQIIRAVHTKREMKAFMKEV